MSNTLSSRLLYLGVAVFIALSIVTARLVRGAFDQRAGQARAAAVFDLVATRTAVRPTDAPGAIAWLRRAVERSGLLDASLADPSDAVPDIFAPISYDLTSSAHFDGGTCEPRLDAPSSVEGSLRNQRFVRYCSRTLIVTRRKTLDDAKSADDGFIVNATPLLLAKDFSLSGRGDPTPAHRSPLDGLPVRMVRIYAVHEDGTLLSLPSPERLTDTNRPDAANAEMALLSGRPNLPAFAPDDFFFRSTSVSYSGFYLDLGGRGLVSTVTAPFIVPHTRGRAVIAVDLAFDVDWTKLASSLEVPIAGAAVYVAPGTSTSWSAFAQSLPETVSPDLRRALGDASGRFASTNTEADSPLRHAVVADGAVAAFHVSDRTWLLAWFPQTTASFPLAAVAMLSLLLVGLLAGFEVNRRRAHNERRTAERALQEKQNLLNTMQVPLIVVDPNTDAIVSANRAAEAIGFSAGRRVADLVWPDPIARAHYERMQVASSEPRRAYGVPVSVTNEDGTQARRYAIVRSVAVTAPIEALRADERHRLGVVIVLEQTPDLDLLAGEIESAAHRDERRRLSGLLSHGVDSLARVLEFTLTHQRDPAFSTWLAEYLERRIDVTSWLLHHWDATPPLPRESVIDAAQAKATIDKLRVVLEMAGRDRELRQRLHWDNGTLSAPAAAVLDAGIEWPDDVVVTCPVHGGFGLFLNEVLTNAVRHGMPGTVPVLRITCDRTRGELQCIVSNQVRDATGPDRGEPYGGISLVRVMARLFEWPQLRFERAGQPTTFTTSWTMPVGTTNKDAD